MEYYSAVKMNEIVICFNTSISYKHNIDQKRQVAEEYTVIPFTLS